MVPLFKGLGYGMLTVRFFVNVYYVVIQAWALFYLAVGMTSELPWGTCEKEFTTYDCYTNDYQERKNTRLVIKYPQLGDAKTAQTTIFHATIACMTTA
jgi:SNF family Na+-dependent transporter